MAKQRSKYINQDGIKGRPIRLNRIRLEPLASKDYAEMIYAGDVHLGHPNSEIDRFKKMLKYCGDHGIYIFLTGDLLEIGTKESIGSAVYEQYANADEQYDEMYEILHPYAILGLIVGFLRGNHEERIYKMSGFDPSKLLAKMLSVPYLGDACWNRISVKDQHYSAYTLHGRTNAKFDGTALLAVERLGAPFFADMIVMGHAHKLISSAVLMQHLTPRGIKEHKKHIIIAGHYLSYDKSYAQSMGLPPSKLGSPKVKLMSTKHEIFVSY